MTAYGFDLDGTLTRPEIAQLANDLYMAGHEVYVITGGLSDTGEWTLEARQERLTRLGVRCTAIIRVLDPDVTRIGRLKGLKCAELGIRVMVDDSAMYAAGIRTAAVTTLQVI